MATRTQLIRWIGTPFYFVFCLVLFTYFTFPYERVREKVRVALEDAFGAEVEIAELSPSWVTGAEARGVQITTRPLRSNETPKTFVIDSITARIGLFALLTGGIDLSVAVEIYGGEIKGRVQRDDAGAQAVIEFADLDLARVQSLREAIGLPLGGTLSGNADLALPLNDVAKANGTIQLRGARIRVGDGRAKLEIPGFSGGLTIKPIEVGSLQGDLLVKDGRANITRLGTSGGDLDLIGEGRIDLRDPMASSSVQAYVRFKINSAYTKRNPEMDPLVSGLDFMPATKRAKRPDGFFGFRVNGTFSRGLSFQPSARQPLSHERPSRSPTSPRRPIRPRSAATPPEDSEPAGDGLLEGPPMPPEVDIGNER